jgi:hypothetical protein
MTGRRMVVVDPEVSANARRDDILFSAVVTIDGVSTLLGTAPYTLPTDAWIELIETREGWDDVPWMTRAELIEMDAASDITDVYLQAFVRGPGWRLNTGDGAREPLHLQWTLSTAFDDALERLRPLALCYEDEEAIALENEPAGDRHAVLTWYQRGPSGDEDDWDEIGYLYLDETRLAADVPTRALATRLADEIAARLGNSAQVLETRSAKPIRVHDRGCWVPALVDNSGGGRAH